MNKIDVYAHRKKVGTLALSSHSEVAFQYSEEWIKNGFSLNPFKLPLDNRVFVTSHRHSHGLFGVFADSLPDSYGELLLERYLKSKNINPSSLTCVDRLAYVGKSGMGLLEYVPSYENDISRDDIDFDLMQEECNKLLDSKPVDDIEALFSLGGSSGGARPKSLIKYEGEDYIVKFSSKYDPKNIAELEYEYMSLAAKCGIDVPSIKLVTGKKGNKYFMIKRFDRDGNRKIHMISVAGVLECDYNNTALDYIDLMKLVSMLTRNNEHDLEQMYRRMIFNVLMDNKDDHAKNFSFLYDEIEKRYRLSPAYDLTPGQTYYGEHTTSVNGKGKDISEDDMLEVANKTHFNIKKAKAIIDGMKTILRKY